MKIHAKFPPVIQLLFWAAMAYLSSLYAPSIKIASSMWIVAAAAIVGAVFLSSALGSFRRSKTTFNPLDPSQASSLVTSGLYQITRNPMYVGLTFLLLAWCIYLASLIAFLALPLFIFTMTVTQIKTEETALLDRFGNDYRAYQRSVKRWLGF